MLSLESLRPPPSPQVQSPTCLEVGCGTGFVITSLARLLQARDTRSVHATLPEGSQGAEPSHLLCFVDSIRTQSASRRTSTPTLRKPRVPLCYSMVSTPRRVHVSVPPSLELLNRWQLFRTGGHHRPRGRLARPPTRPS